METIGTTKPKGRLQARKIKAPGPGLRWQLSNYLRWSFIKGWLAWFVVAPIARKFGVATMLGKLEAVLVEST